MTKRYCRKLEKSFRFSISIPCIVFAVILIPGFALNTAQAQELTSVDVFVKPLGLTSWIPLSLMNLAGASINDLPPYLSRSEFKIRVKADDGNWIGVSLRDSDGDIYDLQAQQVSRRKNDFYWTLPSSFADGAIELTVALWNDYNESSDRMVGELDRISWSYIARKSGGSSW